jgi:signal transduction histidine kinase
MAADAERRRIERDLHDGVQQHLVGIAVNLRLARELAAADPAGADDLLAKLEDVAEQALRGLRDLTHGIYPPALRARGLPDALVAAAAGLSVRAAVDAPDFGRWSPDIEATLYFCAVEALQNVAKHAGADAQARVKLRHDHGALVLTVHDDGDGFDPDAMASGTGLLGMRDRLAAHGGTVRIESAPGHGATITATLPVHGDPRPGTQAPP